MVLEKTPESPLDSKEIQPVHRKENQLWIFMGRTDAEAETLATWCEELTHWKRPWCWERLKAGGEGDDRGWDGWMASPTQWAWVSVNSGSWWWTGRPGVLQSMGLQRVRHDWATEMNYVYINIYMYIYIFFFLSLFHCRLLQDTLWVLYNGPLVSYYTWILFFQEWSHSAMQQGISDM